MNKAISLSFLLIALMMTNAVAGQQPVKFRVMPAVGLSIGEKHEKPFYQFTTGIRYGQRLFSGIGVGYDQYKFNTIPVFLNWRAGLGRQQVLYVYAHGGYNFPVGSQPGAVFDKLTDKIKGGFYMDGGMGVALPIDGVKGVSFSAGFSRKEVELSRTFTPICVTQPCNPMTTDYKYAFARMMLTLSWEFGQP